MNVDFLQSINERLKNERNKLMLTQVEMAEKCGVTPTTYSNYELGKRKPDAKFLQKFSEINGDVQYLFTGKRTAGFLNEQQAMMLELYHSLNNEQKSDVFAYMYGLRSGAFKGGINELLKLNKENNSKIINQSVKGNHNIVAGRDVNR